MDLRQRVIAAIEKGASCREAASRFSVAPSTAINWMRRLRQTGSLAPGQIGGYKPKKLSGPHRDWLLDRCRHGDFTLRGLTEELAERGLQVDIRSVWQFVHAEKLTYKKRRSSRPSKTGRMLRGVASSGSNTAS
jgi:putative transposase